MTELSCEKLSCERPLLCESKQPFFCEKCLKEFTFASNLRKHYLRCSEPEIRKKSLNKFEQVYDLWIPEKPTQLAFPNRIFIGDKLLCLFKWLTDGDKFFREKYIYYARLIQVDVWEIIFEIQFNTEQELSYFLHKKFDI